MRYFFLFLLAITLSPAILQAEPELKGTPTELSQYLSSLPKEVTITGVAKLQVPSESGIVTLGIKTENSKLQKALQNNQKLRDEISTKLVNQGFSRDKITGTQFSSVPEYGLFGKKPSSYVVENIVNITVENGSELHMVAGLVDNYKEVFYQGIELKEQEKGEIKLKLLRKALDDARVRQKIYEDDLGIVLKAFGFEENIALERTPVRPVPKRKSKKLYGSLESDSGGENDLSLGEHIYHGSVAIKYYVIVDKQK